MPLDPGRQTAKSRERMIDDWRKLLSFFSAGERRRLLVLLLGTTVSGLVQAVGIASIMPFIAVVADPSLATENPYLSGAYAPLGFTGKNDFLIFLGLFAFMMLLATNLLVGINAWLTFRVCHLGEYNLARRLMSSTWRVPTFSCCSGIPPSC